MSRPIVLKKRSKFGAIRSEYGGRTYHSKREAAEAYKLDLLVKAGEVAQWWPQVNYKLVVNGHLIATYRADFKVQFKGGHTEIWEVKGMDTPVATLKMALFRALYPNLPIKVIR